MKRILQAVLFCIALVVSAKAQLVTVSGSLLSDSSGASISNAQIIFAPVLTNGTPVSYRKGNGGQVVIKPVSTSVIGGAFSISVANTSVTFPANVCYSVTVIDNVTGENLLGAGYGCVQPSNLATTWCTTTSGVTTCNFDAYTPNLVPELDIIQVGPQGATGATGTSGCIIGSTCTTTLTPANVGGLLYADQCTGTDIGMKINSCVALLPTASSGYKVGTIILPNTSTPSGAFSANSVWATTVRIGPGVSLTGQGQNASVFTCTVVGDCLLHDESASSGFYGHTVGVDSVFQGFTITGNNASVQNIIHLKDAVNLTLRDIGVDGAGVAGSACILLHDVNFWTERNTFENVSTLYGCKIGWRFIADALNPYNPNPSFGYNRFLNIKANPITGQMGVSIENNSYVYNCTFRMTVNADHATIFHMQDNAQFYESELHLFGEGAGNITLDIGATNQFTYTGQISVGPQVNNILAGAVITHWGDDGGFGPEIPTSFFNGISWGGSVPLANGTDLNNLGKCGTFAGNNLTHAPTALGTAYIKVEVICTSDPGYQTQIAYQMEFIGLSNPALAIPRVFQRVKDLNVWAAWREQAWTDQILTGNTGALPATAIAAGACANVTAAIAGATSSMGIVATPAHPSAMNAGLRWDTPFADNAGNVVVPVCNTTGSSITPSSTPTFNVRVIQ